MSVSNAGDGQSCSKHAGTPGNGVLPDLHASPAHVWTVYARLVSGVLLAFELRLTGVYAGQITCECRLLVEIKFWQLARSTQCSSPCYGHAKINADDNKRSRRSRPSDDKIRTASMCGLPV